jgi:hypothetical protein
MSILSLTVAAIVTIVMASYGMGANVEERGSARYLTGSSWVSSGLCMILMVIAIIKFVE